MMIQVYPSPLSILLVWFDHMRYCARGSLNQVVESMISNFIKNATLRPRVIPTLLLDGTKLVKTIQFNQPTYLGDPTNAVRIFNEKAVDELFIADINASAHGLLPQFDFIRELAEECFMPLTYAGGISSLKIAHQLFSSGVEKICVCTAALVRPILITELAQEFGSQSVAVALDVRCNHPGSWQLYGKSGSQLCTTMSPIAFVQSMVDSGAGEIQVTSIDRDGTQSGFDLELIRTISGAVSVPVIANGGASSLADLRQALEAGASGVAAGSMFVFYGRKRGILITYPTEMEIEGLDSFGDLLVESSDSSK